MDYKEYEKEVKKIKKKNEKYLNEFENWLKEKKLVSKTINGHLQNVDFYINEFLNYYDASEMEEGCHRIDEFLGDWFIRKCLWSTPSSVKSNAASIKKFYACMLELGHIDKENYEMLCEIIKENMEEWLETVEEYNSCEDFDLIF